MLQAQANTHTVMWPVMWGFKDMADELSLLEFHGRPTPPPSSVLSTHMAKCSQETLHSQP